MNIKSKKFWMILGTLSGGLSLLAPTSLILAQEAMSSGAYAIQSDSINFAGLLSESSSYSLQDTLGVTSTGDITGTNFSGEIGYQAMRVLVSSDTTAPSQPPSITASPLTSSRIEITWGESTDNVAVTRYYIYRDGARISDVGIFPRSFTDTGLNPDTLYSYNVSAVDDALNESTWSATSTARTFSSPSAPSGSSFPPLLNFSIVPTETLALVQFDTTTAVRTSVSWGTDTNYNSGTLSLDTLSSAHSFLLSGLSPAKTYFLKITLTRQDGYVTTLENISFNTLELPSVVTPPNVTAFTAQALEEDIALSWTLPNDHSIVGVRIKRSKDFYPSSPSDGETVFDGSSTNYLDDDVEKGVRYYYTIFTRDLSGNFSSGVATDAYILMPGEVFVPSEPLEDIEIAGNVDPAIASLKLSDFLFIQDGEIIPIIEDKITLNGKRNLTVALQSYLMPPVLKTIAVTFITQENEPKYFTFILRINRDSTRYEAVVAPLGEIATYTLKITVVDFYNKGLKKLEGLALVSDQVALSTMGPEGKEILIYVLVFISLVLFAIILATKWHGREDLDQKNE